MVDPFRDLSLVVTLPIEETLEELGGEGYVWDSEGDETEDIIEDVCRVMEKFGFKIVDEFWEPKDGKYVMEFQDLTQRSIKNLMKQVEYLDKGVGRKENTGYYFVWNRGLPGSVSISYELYLIDMDNGELFHTGQILAMVEE